MEEFEKQLTKDELELLEKIKPDFRDLETDKLWEWLLDYEQENGINDIDIREDLQIIDDIIDILADY